MKILKEKYTRLDDNTKIDHKGIGCGYVDWIELVHVKVQLRTLMITVKPRALYNAENGSVRIPFVSVSLSLVSTAWRDLVLWMRRWAPATG